MCKMNHHLLLSSKCYAEELNFAWDVIRDGISDRWRHQLPRVAFLLKYSARVLPPVP
jgi:hypothetical protein